MAGFVALFAALAGAAKFFGTDTHKLIDLLEKLAQTSFVYFIFKQKRTVQCDDRYLIPVFGQKSRIILHVDFFQRERLQFLDTLQNVQCIVAKVAAGFGIQSDKGHNAVGEYSR